MWINTEQFRYEAKNFLRQGFYCADPPGSQGYHAYWTEQLRRCREGYSIGGQTITGHHYHYLNFTQMKLTEAKSGDQLIKTRTQNKVTAFPDFWDGDALYYEALAKAVEQGKHLCVGKARRKGFSYKNASLAANTYNTVRESYCMLGAHDKKYLYPKGIMTKAVDVLNFMNMHTGWAKRRQVVNKTDIVKASYYEYVGNQPVEKGYKSIIQSITFKDNAYAANGQDSTIVLFEEAGIFDNLIEAYAETKPCVEDGDTTTGTIIMFGTGGDMEGGSQDFEAMFYDPDTYGLLAFENIWDDNAEGTFCSFFAPSYQNRVGSMDKEGNSLIEDAKEKETVIRLEKKNSKVPGAFDKHTRGYPWKPREAFQLSAGNIFPTGMLQEHRNDLVRTGLHNKIAVSGNLTDTGSGVKFRPDPSANPVTKFPHDKTKDASGCVVMYEAPYRDENGNVPEGMYYIEHDPYAQDGGTGGSLGSAYVKKRINPFSKPDDIYVAHYVGRPPKQDDYNENLFLLIRYYNAMMGFENDRGEVIPYAKRHNMLRFLDTEPELLDKSSGFRLKKLGRTYGCSMGSEERKGQAEIYLRDWLITPRSKDENGNVKLNLHCIYDLALLDELIKYNRKGNFDRVSSLLVGRMFAQASYQKVIQETPQEPDTNSFFNRQLFV